MRTLVFGRRPRRTLLRALFIVAAAIVVFGSVLIPVRGVGPSMSPSVEDGQLVFVYRFAYARATPRRGDIVALRLAGQHALLVKRIVGLPGERVRLDAGVVHVDGAPLDEPYVRQRRAWTTGEVTLSHDDYLVIGDNRGMAMENHDFGIATGTRILGRVVRLP